MSTPSLGSSIPRSAYGAAAGAGLGGLMSNLFGWNQNPADDAMKFLNQAQDTMKPYYQPYIDAGLKTMPTLQQQYSSMLSDPTAMMNKIGSGYQASPGYNWQVGQMTNAANRVASAGGMLGSPAEQQQLAQNINGLANQDYYNYVDRGLNMYNQGLNGMSGINQMGYGASTGLGNNLASTLLSQAQLAYAGRANQNQSNGGSLGGLIGGLAGLFF